MKDKIQEINEEIAKLRNEMAKKCNKLIEKRDKLIDEQNPPFLNPYIKLVDSDGNKAVAKVGMPYHEYDTGEIFAYRVKIINYEGVPFYHNDYYLTLIHIKEWKFISKEEFEELLKKGLELIRKDII